MCLIVVAWQQHAVYPLLLAANRDEFHRRPAAPAAFWEDYPQLLAGRDLEAGGTWLGVSERGRFAAITNIRDPQGGASAPRSRGELTRDFLAGDQSAGEFLSDVAARRSDYLGFNLLVADGSGLWYLHGDARSEEAPRRLPPAIYGLSNAALDVPWPKVLRAREAMHAVLGQAGPAAPDLTQLACTTDSRDLASPEALSRQGLVGDMARPLSAQFIVGATYGTRSRSLLRWHRDGQLEFLEQRYDSSGALSGEDHFELAAPFSEIPPEPA